MQKALTIFTSILFVLTGCNYVYDKPLSNEQILNRLERYIDEKQTIVLSYNPALQYEVTVTKDFLEILHIHDWTIDPDNSIPKDNLSAMVYFDLHNGKEKYNKPMINFVLLETCPSSRVVPSESPAFTCFGDHYQGVEYEVFAEDDNWRWTSIEFYKDRIANLNLSYDDFRVNANHEIGHALGLAHITDDTGVIMYPTGLRTATVPTAADLERIYDLYG